MSARGQHSGRVLLVQNTREGWESITEADGIPCLIGKYVHQDGGEYLPYYEVDSPYLEFHYPMLAEKLGWRWFWPADEMDIMTLRDRMVGDVPEGSKFILSSHSRVNHA